MAGVSLFVYGTLMDEALLRALTGRRFARRPATLAEYARIQPGGGYPYIVAEAGGTVEGMLIEGIDAASLARLDRYEDEGRLYHRRTVEVTVEGRVVACETYVGVGDSHRRKV